MAATPTEIVQTWSESIHKGDFAKARSVAREDLHFRGPIDTFDRVDDYIAALKRLGGMVRGMEPEATLSDGNQVASAPRARRLAFLKPF